MSTLNVNTVQSSTSNPPIFKNSGGTVVGTLCRAWVNFNGTGTVTIRDSFNVSSITDAGTGLYTINFTNALSNTNYSWAGTCSTGSNATDALISVDLLTNTAQSLTMTTSTLTVETVYVQSTANRTRFDAQFVSINVFSN